MAVQYYSILLCLFFSITGVFFAYVFCDIGMLNGGGGGEIQLM
jgi:hypothetical protein